MPLLRAVPAVLSAGERTALNKRVRGAKTAHRDRLRADRAGCSERPGQCADRRGPADQRGHRFAAKGRMTTPDELTGLPT